jgi:predicted glycoside hydrolase/deacetylase ChbG (UPF0249 family)
MRRLIVNADDFGLTSGVSEGILEAHRHGIVTSTTMLVNRPIARAVLDRLADSDLGVGLHVNLTLGRPLTRASSLTGADGQFVREPVVVAARARPADVVREIAAQIEAFERLLGRPPDHLDSHHHVGMSEPIRTALLEAGRALAVPVRSPDATARAAARSAGVRTPDRFFGGAGPDAYWTIGRALRHLRELPPGTAEFMTHPGHFDAALAYSRYGRQRETELIGLGSPTVRAAATSLGIHLITFRHLR